MRKTLFQVFYNPCNRAIGERLDPISGVYGQGDIADAHAQTSDHQAKGRPTGAAFS